MSSLGQICLGWWKTELQADTGSARALRARLRRSDSAVDALSERAVIQLWEQLAAEAPALASAVRREPERLAVLVQVLATVKEHKPQQLMQLLGGDPPALSSLRFQRLLRSPDIASLGVALRRALPLAGEFCNVAQLAEDLLRCDEAVRTRWCFEYFGAAVPTPIKPVAEGSGPVQEEPVA
ncbi:type I-E CRISPR-associated protein Cse2/CasB [Rubellimicrobium roseum]|uniref:Type I-E CRISPR-associated protein Cse2/CasB n=1 Tax=Rubellimicrobium roseum TaxID=687525 RepID=A0A5C4NH71_9RHOB|nr:type I-E CRISPR-associated protein Cse2/CasB [Rubellimicrobium roseum]TNC72037.1 type I-E CRISPR-associated protein Cse2/CasB [Rubellimicrobium roseum]